MREEWKHGYVEKVAEALEAQVVSGQELMDRTVSAACGSDMMSDVLAYAKDDAVLLTGLLNVQVVRTADVSDAAALIFVRDKHPENDVLLAARPRTSRCCIPAAPCSKPAAGCMNWACGAARPRTGNKGWKRRIPSSRMTSNGPELRPRP
jgi:hypothetical protein